MRVTSVSVRDFRNYERAEAELGEQVTVVYGPNGAGKTNLLEAIYFALTGRSCRTSADRELIRHGAGPALVAVATVAEDGPHSLEVGLDPGVVKQIHIDGTPAAGPAGLDARPPVGVFLPDRLELVKGAPARRRAHLDQFVAALWPGRAGARATYARALGQRNALLARVRAGADAAQLDSWDLQLARCAAPLIDQRAEALERLAPSFAARAGELGLADRATIEYRPRCRARDAEGIAAELGERRAHDLDRGFTTHGPHRDDLALAHGGRSLRAYGSQGQQRLALLALLLSERDLLGERGRLPLLLLDDVMSELDAERRDRLVGLVAAGGQVVITATDPEHVPIAHDVGVALIRVEGGAVHRVPRALAA